MNSSTVRSLAFVALSAILLTTSCATFLAMEPYPPVADSSAVSFE